ncbi:MAG: peptidoglycan-binding protein, partial [Bacteroidota bacterium]
MPKGRTLNLGDIVEDLLDNFALPTSFLPADLSITSFDLSADIPSGDKKGNYSVKSSLEWKFTLPVIDQAVDIIAAFGLTYDGTKPVGSQYAGMVMGKILLKDIHAELDIGYKFEKDAQLLMIQWEGFVAEYDVAGQSQTITFRIEKWSVGELITSFMKMLFDPTFELDAPWDVLNKISLDGFEVIYNLTNKDVTVEYSLPSSLNLVFINITGLKLTKNAKGVQISFDGSSVVPSLQQSSIFDKEKGEDVKDLPKVPGKGNKYFDLRLLAMGQHIALKDINQYKTIQQVTTAMENAFEEPADGTIPIVGSSLLSFDENSNWLVASDFGILNTGTDEKPVYTLDLQVVFNDPNLYGLRIAMAGSNAKVLAGLEFEIMYKKISDSIGVYQIDFTLPTALRYLQFGAVNITLPSIGVQIYTNGDFMVDIGFPYNLDFSRSFTVQAIVPPGIPALGSGGFYFGKLSSATTNKVPQTNYGLFNP